MGTVYLRGKTYWMAYRDSSGKRVQESTGLTREDEARELLRIVERKVAASLTHEAPQLEGLTVRRYFERWVREREERGLSSARDDRTRLERHAMPDLGHLPLVEVRTRHVRDLIRKLRTLIGPTKKQLAPRTVRHVYGLLHRMFEDALADELIGSNPCVLKKGDLPPKVDKNPEWRSTAVFTREEVEPLLSDARLPEDRRVLYALLFLTGMRIGEAVALRWNAWDASARPLGRLRVSRAFHRKQRREKGVKTERPREVPVHPVLARVLDAWRQEGWERKQGRPPTADDLVVPSRRGEHRRDPVVHAQLLEDLELLGLRGRRVHDTRRTFISLALADGADRDKLAWVTHGPKGDIVSLYTTLPWDALCTEVAKLKVELRPPSTPPAGGAPPSDEAP